MSYDQIVATVRRIHELREQGADDEAIDLEIAQARALWDRRKEVPFGIQLKWPDDLRAIAVELGFAEPRATARDAAATPAETDDAAIAAGIAAARQLYAVVAQIDREIQSSVSGISDLRVAAAADRIVLTGTAADNTAKSRAGSVAQQIASTATIDNQLVIR
ncbi:MAG TPA: hypothetical protein VL326_14355 [Kofleriaceae bacterium]|jgi:nucleotide-binding universal stress UspA family protein|nr:hypothetical protein [Kofleriaceae bacterium]